MTILCETKTRATVFTGQPCCQNFPSEKWQMPVTALAICPGEENTNKKTYDYESLLPICHPAGLQHVKGRISNIHITLYRKMSLVDA